MKYVVGWSTAGITARMPSTVEPADLLACGMSGLLEALDTFEASREPRFELYALDRIKEAILGELREAG